MALGQVGLGSNHRNAEKNIKKSSSPDRLAQMLIIWHVALPSNPLSTLFKRRSQGLKLHRARGPKFEPQKYTEIYLKLFFFRTTHSEGSLGM